MEVTDNMIDNLAVLSRLRFSEEEKLGIKADLQKMISFVEQLQLLDLEGVAPLQHMTVRTDVLREDVVQGSMSKSIALKNAPMADDNYFKVPKVINK